MAGYEDQAGEPSPPEMEPQPPAGGEVDGDNSSNDEGGGGGGGSDSSGGDSTDGANWWEVDTSDESDEEGADHAPAGGEDTDVVDMDAGPGGEAGAAALQGATEDTDVVDVDAAPGDEGADSGASNHGMAVADLVKLSRDSLKRIRAGEMTDEQQLKLLEDLGKMLMKDGVVGLALAPWREQVSDAVLDRLWVAVYGRRSVLAADSPPVLNALRAQWYLLGYGGVIDSVAREQLKSVLDDYGTQSFLHQVEAEAQQHCKAAHSC